MNSQSCGCRHFMPGTLIAPIRVQLFSHLMSAPSSICQTSACRDIFEKLKEAWMAARIATTVGHEHHGQF